jgi:hypothetical protein
VAFRRFHGMGVTDFRSLRYDIYVCMHRFVRRSSRVPLLRFWGMSGENSCNVSLLLLMLPWVRRDALQKGSVDDVACLRAPRA